MKRIKSYLPYLFFLLIGVGKCTEICYACRPPDRENSPGIGIDLALGYGVAVLCYGNGTIIDVAKIDDDEAYIKAMKDLAEEALRIPINFPYYARLMDLPGFSIPPPPQPNFNSESWETISSETTTLNETEEAPETLPSNIRPSFNLTRLPERYKRWVEAISPLISTLKSRVDAVHKLDYPAIILSIPDFCFHLGPCGRYFDVAASVADFDTVWPIMYASSAAVYSRRGPEISDLGFYHEDDDDSLFDKSVETALVVDYSNAAISLTLLQRAQSIAILDPVEFYMEPKLGANGMKSQQSVGKFQNEVYDWVQASFNQTVFNTVGDLVLTGDAATSSVIHDVLHRVLKDNYQIKRQDHQLSHEDYTFFRGRAMARRAWGWMMDKHDGCLPLTWCPGAEEEFERHYRDDEIGLEN
ncbi:hypothetical protein TWF225_010786 [Orbilia oligospora]|uniref:Uncharacterized protein n=1 Tax=Orbilia oligospora TaxID=2813651 RepID=A0A7C8NYX6_ORBOL|nr:hypothetical protein TWF751_011296 [Orbilia oligospora]KAF3170483.1 hypothetical protein TWF225_010786 [Orbilia oligospora]KAF3243152.1 hypothetical protein TWF217_011305 [Orbilia oligospora]KAF3268503.1 hypothetical protein TWF128_006906 [Orbilia oligospora]KAF3296976.1 hypothetical protein TWF132_008349 [Orbilia oligospora]